MQSYKPELLAFNSEDISPQLLPVDGLHLPLTCAHWRMVGMTLDVTAPLSQCLLIPNVRVKTSVSNSSGFSSIVSSWHGCLRGLGIFAAKYLMSVHHQRGFICGCVVTSCTELSVSHHLLLLLITSAWQPTWQASLCLLLGSPKWSNLGWQLQHTRRNMYCDDPVRCDWTGEISSA